MPEPDFYAEDLPLIERIAKAWWTVRGAARVARPHNADEEWGRAANISLIAALHKRCEIAEARIKVLEDDLERRRDAAGYIAG